MKSSIKGDLLFLIPLTAIALTIYLVHYMIFGSLTATISGLILSLAYVPIGVLYETLIIRRIIDFKEELKLERKINIVKSTFYKEVGTPLLGEISTSDNKISEVMSALITPKEWSNSEFQALKEELKEHQCDLNFKTLNLEYIAKFLDEKDDFMLSLILNPITADFEDFNNLILDVLHLRDELSTNNCCSMNTKVINTDFDYDLNTALCQLYHSILLEWVEYMKYLKTYYPILFQRELKNSPFFCVCKLKK